MVRTEQPIYAFAFPADSNDRKFVILHSLDKESKHTDYYKIPCSRNEGRIRTYGEHMTGCIGMGKLINLQPLLETRVLSSDRLLDLDK